MAPSSNEPTLANRFPTGESKAENGSVRGDVRLRKCATAVAPQNWLAKYVFHQYRQAMKATASDLARDTATILTHVQAGRKVEIQKRGKVVATIQSVRAGTGKKLYDGLASLSKKDRLALKSAIAEGKKAIVGGGWS